MTTGLLRNVSRILRLLCLRSTFECPEKERFSLIFRLWAREKNREKFQTELFLTDFVCFSVFLSGVVGLGVFSDPGFFPAERARGKQKNRLKVLGFSGFRFFFVLKGPGRNNTTILTEKRFFFSVRGVGLGFQIQFLSSAEGPRLLLSLLKVLL